MIEGKGRFAAAPEKENLLPYLPGGVKLRQSFSPQARLMYEHDSEPVPRISSGVSSAIRGTLLLACSSHSPGGRPILLGILPEQQLLMRTLRVPK